VLPLTIGTPLSAFTEIAGDVPLESVAEQDFLETIGADGIDMFY
jgi:hypothetical protein